MLVDLDKNIFYHILMYMLDGISSDHLKVCTLVSSSIDFICRYVL